MRILHLSRVFALGLLLFSPVITASQTPEERFLRGSIPQELLRPNRSESPRYPIDMVIGELGQGSVSSVLFNFAINICAGFVSGQTDHRGLASINQSAKEYLLSSLEVINPVSYRIGGGREEADGAFSFLVRFIGREQGITGELYIRHVTKQTEREDGEIVTTSAWVFEELLLEEAKSREAELQESIYRYDFFPYERFF
ncbi:MAG: hypothetical protein FWB77_01880 [Treponema sp.]|nr:hypothetical protein [Treponema sp.]